MADRVGWFKVYRKMQENPIIMKDTDHLAIWMYLLMNVEFLTVDKWFGGKRITLQPGQGIFTLAQISTDLGVSKAKCKRVLDDFKSETQIETQVTNRNTLISIVGWDVYQGSETESETPVKHEWNASETPTYLYKNTRREEEKKKTRARVRDYDSIYEDAPPELHDAMRGFEEMRKKIKSPLTERAFRQIMKKVNDLSGGDIGKCIEILDQSTINGWKSVYELKAGRGRDRSKDPF